MHIQAYLMRVLMVLIFLIAAKPAFAYEWMITRSYDGSISGDRFQTTTRQSTGDNFVDLSGTGGERSECRPYGRPSAARSQGSASVRAPASGVAEINFSSSSNANGGHYRTCGACVARNCAGIHGNDTKASATSAVHVLARSDIPKDKRHLIHNLRISLTSFSGTIELVVLADAKEVARGTSSVTARIDPDVASVSVKLVATSSATDAGGCCTSNSLSAGNISLRLEAEALVASRSTFHPYVRLGVVTTAYPHVVSIGLNGQLHCSGTIIGSKTVLTAAHCIKPYIEQIAAGKLDVRLGNVFSPNPSIIAVSAFDYPVDADKNFFFDDANDYKDDIGLLYVDQELRVEPAKLHGDDPRWSAIHSEQRLIELVGFGFTDPINTGLGYRRTARVFIDAFDDRRFEFGKADPNSCNGDSGGAVLALTNDTVNTVLVGVISGGFDGCTRGRNSRLDAFMPWIKSRVR